MTCKKCKHEYCWICLGAWSKHGGDFYTCNRFDPDAAKAKEANKASSRAALDRYVWHFHRYINHQNSQKLELQTRVKAEAKVKALQETAPDAARGWGDVAFVQQGTEEAIRCRGVLKWTYVLAFGLPDASPVKDLFCYLQQDLEQRTERLSGLLESDAETLMQPAVRAEILALVGVAAAARKKLVRGVEERGLAEGLASVAAAAAEAGGAGGSGSGAAGASDAGAAAAADAPPPASEAVAAT
jgi:ariadne-1